MLISNSQPRSLPRATPSAAALELEDVIQATVVMNPRNPSDRTERLADIRRRLPKDRRILHPDEYECICGADPDLFRAIQDYAVKKGLEIVQGQTSLERRAIALRGKLSTFAEAFDVKFSQHERDGITHRTFTGHIDVPDRIHRAIQYVLGLDSRTVTHPHLFLRSGMVAGSLEGAGLRPGAPSPFQPVEPGQVAGWYDFPSDATGEGQCIGIVILSSGFRPDDVNAYFEKRHLPGGRVAFEEHNQPASRNSVEEWWEAAERAATRLARGQRAELATTGNEAEDLQVLWTVESTMDVELAGTFAPRAQIMVYFGTADAQGKYHALARAVTDRERHPSVISCSWGCPEKDVDPSDFRVLETVFEDAALRGITVCCSSGDTPGVVSYPASSPHALSCGGTHAVLDGGHLEETVWKQDPLGSGGGMSGLSTDTPPWQKSVGVPAVLEDSGRGDPDVAAKADLLSGYKVLIYGDEIVSGGTSASAPLWAGLIALINQKLGRPVGFINPWLYSDAFRNATRPTDPSKRWSRGAGLGSPNGRELLKALSGATSPTAA